MLQVTKEMKGFVNEVGFISKVSTTEFNLKYYSAEREVDFCCHATIAIMYDLLKTDSLLQQSDKIIINTKRGKLWVKNSISSNDAVFMMAPVPVYKNHNLQLKDIALKLKINANDVDLNLPIELINAGLSTLLVPIKSLDSILGVSPDLEDLKAFCLDSGIDIIEVFTDDVSNKSCNYRTRVFAPTFGYIEDSATGSGNSALGYYLSKNGVWEGDTINVEQNGSKDNPNIIKLQKCTDTNGDERVMFGGGAITRIIGDYILH
jgi:PhzF family phenazine biosynthesis protein